MLYQQDLPLLQEYSLKVHHAWNGSWGRNKHSLDPG
jgi:hypothetical protein